jgi:hypothetical protein
LAMREDAIDSDGFIDQRDHVLSFRNDSA